MKDDLHRFIWSIVVGFIVIYLLSVVLATIEHRGIVESRSNRLSSPVVQGNKAFLSTNSPNYHHNQVLGSMIAKKYEVPEYIITEIKKYDWNSKLAVAIMMAESHAKPKEQNMNDYHPVGNCRGSFGLFQLACFRGSWSDLVNPEYNIELAYELWKREGWHPWGAYKNKSYLKFYE